MSSVDRRDFLRRAGLGTAGVVALTEKQQAQAASLEERGAFEAPSGPVDWQKAPCRYCGVGCGVEVGLSGGRVVSVRGDEKAEVNNGDARVLGIIDRCDRAMHLRLEPE